MTWCVKYTGDINLDDINKAGQYSGDYEEMYYLHGDFSACLEDMKAPEGKYNLYTNNCSQVSLGILAKLDTLYQLQLKKAAEKMLPSHAFSKLKGFSYGEIGGVTNSKAMTHNLRFLSMIATMD